MSHIEDLEEYDAELELRLKREYATVFNRHCANIAGCRVLAHNRKLALNDTAVKFAPHSFLPSLRNYHDKQRGLWGFRKEI